jgi:hypothetical protein
VAGAIGKARRRVNGSIPQRVTAEPDQDLGPRLPGSERGLSFVGSAVEQSTPWRN